MRWSQHPLSPGAYGPLSETGPAGSPRATFRRPRRPDWSEPAPQDTYICCAYSPRCFIIQKVKPSNQSNDELADQTHTTAEVSGTALNRSPQEPLCCSMEPNSSSNGHVCNISSGDFQTQVAANRCSSCNATTSFLNLESHSNKHSEVQVVLPAMEDSTGIATPPPMESASSTANTTPVPSEPITYPTAPGHMDIYPTNTGHMENVEIPFGERTIPLQELKAMLRQQLEYYFSRENLSTDAYLISQMDSDNFVPISTIAKFNQIKRLTEDISLVVEVLRESAVVQVDDAGERVRPNPRSGVLILREIPESTPIKDFEELFSSENCPKFSRCEFAHNNSWYVLFDTDEDTQKAYRYLREEAKTFNGKPIMARIKAKAITSAPFTPSYKNGPCAAAAAEAEPYGSQNVNQQQSQAQVQYAYTNVPNEGYNNQQVCPPFYPPTMLQAWAPTTPTCVDLGTVLSVNGLSPQAAFRPLNSSTSRHSYSSRDRPVKAYPSQNYSFSRNEQNRYFNNRGQSMSYLPRQQQPSFHNIVNTNFDYLPYSSRSRGLHNFGMDMNFFTAPNLYYSKLPSIYPTHPSQSRPNPMLVPRNQVGIGAINSQDQSYLAVGSNTVLPYSKDSSSATSGVSKQSSDSQAKENWSSNQRQRGKRWWKENGNGTNSKSFSENSNGHKSHSESDAKSESPKFDLETTSFPPLPGCLETDIIDVEVYESRLSDIVKGTVKPTTRDSKTQTSESSLTCMTKDSSTLTIEAVALPSDGAFTPPMSPEILKEAVFSNDLEPANVCQNLEDWEEPYVESSSDSVLCSSSISSTATTTVPEATVVLSTTSPAFHPVATNSLVNGNVTTSESSTSTMPEPEITANVPSEIEPKQTAVRMPKAKQLDLLPKNRQCDLPPPKNKTPDSISTKNKFDSFKDNRAPNKHRTSFSNSKPAESSSSKDRVHDVIVTKTIENSASKGSDVREKPVQGHSKSRVFDSAPNKTKAVEMESSLLSVNGHIDSESTVSSEDEKPSRKLTYSEVAIRAKEKVEKIAQELKEKERHEAMVRHHRQQDNVPPNKPAAAISHVSGPFREFPRGRIVESRPGSKELRERRKQTQARTISLPTAGQ